MRPESSRRSIVSGDVGVVVVCYAVEIRESDMYRTVRVIVVADGSYQAETVKE